MTAMSDRHKKICQVTIVGTIVNVILVGLKFVFGYLGNSSALIADAVHSLSDFITDILILFFVRISTKPPDASHHYGHGKYETIASFIIGLILIFVALDIVVTGSIKLIRWLNGYEIESPDSFVLIVALFSVFAKELLYRYTLLFGKKLKADVLINNALHHRSDAISSIGAFLGIGGAILLGNRWTVLDPVTSIIIGIVLLKTAFEVSKNSINDLSDRSLSTNTEREIRAIILSFPYVFAPHNLHTRRIGDSISIEVHVRMDGNMSLNDAHEYTSQIEKRLKEHFGQQTHVIIHTEPVLDRKNEER